MVRQIKRLILLKRLGVTIIEYNERLGHNVGRAIGALEATGDILLFIDGDFSVSGVICIIYKSSFSWCRHSIK